MILDATYWEERYEQCDTPWQLSEVSRPLRYIIDHLTHKNLRILIPGAGNSKAVFYLLANGFTNITVLDIANAPLKELAAKLKDLKYVRLLNEDYFSHTGTYDCILEQTFFCALEFRFRESYPKKSCELLSENGFISGVLFNFHSDRLHPPYGGSAEEYRKLFEPYFNIDILEPCKFSEDSRKGKELLIHFRK